MDDMEKARKVYQDLSDSGLTANERKACRDLFLYRGQIFLRDKQPDRSYRDFVEFRALGGQLPEALSTTYGRLVATYGDFVPLEKVGYWTYVSTTLDYNYTLQVNRQENGAHVMVRREGGNQVSEEKWWRQGIYLTREVGETVYKLPVNLHPAEAALPVIEYTSRGMQCTSEVVEIDQTVEVSGKGAFQHCLKVRMVQKSYASDGSAHTTKHIFYFAPDVGEVKQEIYRDNIKVSEIVLSDHSAREAAPGR
jgi:hypothetical protein